MRHRNSVVIVSEKGKPVVSVSVNRPVAAIAIALALIGIAAYFIPSGVFHFSSTDLRQQQDLGRSNSLLRPKIQAASQMLVRAMERIDLLNAKIMHVASSTGGGAHDGSSAGSVAEPPGEQLSAEELGARIGGIDSIIGQCSSKLGNWNSLFDNMPVCNPLLGVAVVCRRFEVERDPFSGRKKIHRGIDIAATPGTPIIATASGTVTCSENNPVWGKKVVVEHARGFRTVYAHLGSLGVVRGQKVKRGATIGTVGCTGFATGPHVHYEIWRDGRPVDPERYFFPAGTETVKIMQ